MTFWPQMIPVSCQKVLNLQFCPTNQADDYVDPTDKYDYSFLCGDLNFRLDISRLHADWLISRQGCLSTNADIPYLTLLMKF